MDQYSTSGLLAPNSGEPHVIPASITPGAISAENREEERATVGALIATAKATMVERGPVDAIRVWLEIRERFPNLSAGHIGYAEALKEAGRLAEAEGLLSESVERFPDDVWARIHYAQAAARRGDWTEALKRWQEIRDRFPDEPSGHVGYAEALKDGGRLDEAEGLLAESVRRFTDNLWAWIHYAQVAMNRSDWPEALKRWQEIRNRFPDKPSGHVGFAEALKGAGRLGEAEGLLAESIHRFADDPWAWIHYARVAMHRGDWMETLRRWREVRTRFPREPAGNVGYAEALREAGGLRRRSQELLRLLRPHRVDGFQKARFGSLHDGGYVMVHDFAGVATALSFGIAQDANWDAVVADQGIVVYQFDHTIDAPPISRPDLIFAKVRTAAEMIEELIRHCEKAGEASLILKIDIEGDEWEVLDSVSTTVLSRFAQIVAEFHFFGNVMVSPDWYEQALRVFEKLSRNFAVVHVHANNGHGINNLANVMVPHILEVSFVNKSRYKLAATDEVFPGPFDAPNDPNLPDIPLGRFIY